MNEFPAGSGTADVDGAPLVARGSLRCYRIVDVAEAIELGAVEKLLAADGSKRHDTFVRPPPRRDRVALRRAMPTLGIELGPVTVDLAKIDRKLTGKATAHVYERGTFAIAFSFPIAKGTSVAALPRVLRQLFDEPALTDAARREVDGILERIGPAVKGRHDWSHIDAYTLVFLEELAGGATAADLAAWPGTPRLLLGETAPEPLHPRQIAEVMAPADGYQAGDLFILGDRCALVLEPTGDPALPQVLEYVRAQIHELAYLDEQLDADLERAHQAVASPRHKVLQALWDPHGRAAHQIARRLAETTRFTQRIDASMKLLGDSYLTRVARAAFARFGSAELQASIAHKQSLVASVHEMLHADAQALRGLVLEITIVLLIVIEVVFALFIE